MNKKRIIVFSLRKVIFVIFFATAFILIFNKIIAQDESSSFDFLPYGVAILALGVFLYSLNFYARRKFKYLIWGMKALKMQRYEDAQLNLMRFLEYLEKNPRIEIWKKLALGVRKTSLKGLTYFYIGVSLFKLEKTEEALKSFKSALNIIPDFTEAMFDAAISASKLGKTKEALMSLSKIKNPSEHLKNQAKNAVEFKNIKDEKIFQKFIEQS